jgi:gas vesicle protein
VNLIEALFNPVGAAARDGGARARRARARLAGPRPAGPGLIRGLLVAAGGAIAGALAAFLLDPDRGRSRRARYLDQAAAAVRRGARQAQQAGRAARSTFEGRLDAVSADRASAPDLNDAALAQKVETQLFRNRRALKGTVNINVEGGVVVLRGEVPDDGTREALETRAARIDGVWSVRNLLHLPGEPAPESLVRTVG